MADYLINTVSIDIIKGFIIVCICLCESFPQVFGGNPLVTGLWMPD
jgi:hypothetical protein